MNNQNKILEQEAYVNIRDFIKSEGNHNFILTKDDEGITIENEKFKYKIQRNLQNEFDNTYGLKIFHNNQEIVFIRRPTENGGYYDEFHISLSNFL